MFGPGEGLPTGVRVLPVGGWQTRSRSQIPHPLYFSVANPRVRACVHVLYFLYTVNSTQFNPVARFRLLVACFRLPEPPTSNATFKMSDFEGMGSFNDNRAFAGVGGAVRSPPHANATTLIFQSIDCAAEIDECTRKCRRVRHDPPLPPVHFPTTT
jgi:hypothetical protein